MTSTQRADNHGLPLSTSSDAAAEAYRQGTMLMQCGWPGAEAQFELAIATDPNFALAHAALARLDHMSARGAQARKGIAHAQTLVAQSGDERERSHVSVLAEVIGGAPALALIKTLAHADLWPRDIMILGLPLGAFGLFAFSGMADHNPARVELCARHAAHFGADDWWFLTYYGWALAENGGVAKGRAMLERAIDLKSDNAHGAHALAHAMFEAGEHAQTEQLIADWLPGYDSAGILHGHIAWHAALCALERGDAPAAMSIYRSHVHPSVSKGVSINVVTDGAALLWRMDAYGDRVDPALWRELSAYANGAFPRPGHGFVDTHMALIEASLLQGEAAAERASTLDARISEGKYAAGPLVPAICRAALAFKQGHPADCAAILTPMVPDFARIGGSNAQREILEDTLILALMQSGQTAPARTLIDQRLHRRPSIRDAHWQQALVG
jgi:hypothetical protein